MSISSSSKVALHGSAVDFESSHNSHFKMMQEERLSLGFQQPKGGATMENTLTQTILRTRSLDDHRGDGDIDTRNTVLREELGEEVGDVNANVTEQQESDIGHEHLDNSNNSSSVLHSSFDSALMALHRPECAASSATTRRLRSDSYAAAVHNQAPHHSGMLRLRAASSWDEHDSSSYVSSGIALKLSAQKRLRAQVSNSNNKNDSRYIIDKLPSMATVTTSTTPRSNRTPMQRRFRPPHPSTVVKKSGQGKLLTPVTAKRHWSHHRQRLSPSSRAILLHPPVHHNSEKTAAIPSQPTSPTAGNERHTRDDSLAVAPTSFHKSRLPTNGAHNNRNMELLCPSPFLASAAAKKPAKVSLGTTTTAASTVFRSRESPNCQYADDTLDTVDYDDKTTSPDSHAPFRFTSFPASLPRIHNNNNHNPSMSASIATTEQQQLQAPMTVRKRMSFGGPVTAAADDEATNNTSISSTCLLDAACSDDDDDCSPARTRTRLNFNTVLSPAPSFDHQKKEDYTDVLAMHMDDDGENDSNTENFTTARHALFENPLHCRKDRNICDSSSLVSSAVKACFSATENCEDENFAYSATGMTPSRSNEVGEVLRNYGLLEDRPATPKEVQLHFSLDGVNTQCSPIPGIPEEDGDVSTSTKSSTAVLFPHQSRSSLSSRESTPTDTGSKQQRSTTQKSRPMPDMKAFCDHSADDTTSTVTTCSRSRQSLPPSPKLLCPPTPVRTPAWAQQHSVGTVPKRLSDPSHPLHVKYARSDSLIATKVLATCTPQIMDNIMTQLEKSQQSMAGKVINRANKSLNSDRGQSKDNNGSVIPTNAEMDKTVMMDNTHVNKNDTNSDCLYDPRSPAPLGLPRHLHAPVLGGNDCAVTSHQIISMSTNFEILSILGSGTFGDVYKVRSRTDGRLYAVKRNRRQFLGKRDRDLALAEVRCMQRVQTAHPAAATSTARGNGDENRDYSLYLLFFFQAWQEEGHFFCQTELCCRDTLRELMDSLRLHWNTAKVNYPSIRKLPALRNAHDDDTMGRLVHESTVWKVCHDVVAGLSHIHAHGIVHHDIKPNNVFLVSNSRFGATCKIGDFGMAGEVGTAADGQEGDCKYMAPELLMSGVKHFAADIFSLGLTLFELASDLSFSVPAEGPRWHELRSGRVMPDMSTRSPELVALVNVMLQPDKDKRPAATSLVKLERVATAGRTCDEFLRDYISDTEEYDRCQKEMSDRQRQDDQTPRTCLGRPVRVCSPSMAQLPIAPMLYSPAAEPT